MKKLRPRERGLVQDHRRHSFLTDSGLLPVLSSPPRRPGWDPTRPGAWGDNLLPPVGGQKGRKEAGPETAAKSWVPTLLPRV